MSGGDAPGLSRPALGVIDSHCHLQSLEPADREAALSAARERGVRGFLVPGIQLDDAEVLLDLCHRYDDVWCAVGTHPHAAKTWKRGDAERLAELAADPKVVAIGECGLDFHYDYSPRDDQFRALHEQWEVAIELGLPVVVHNRESNQEMLEVVRRPEFDALRADFHSFSAGAAMGEELLDRGFFLGLSGMITFPRADNVREVIPLAPRDRLMVETDSPYLAPVPHRGKPNRPAFVVEVVERLAQEWGEEVSAAVERTRQTFFRCFDRANDPGVSP